MLTPIETRADEDVYAAERLERRRADLERKLGVPKRHAAASFESYQPKTAKQRKALKTVRAWAEAPLTDAGLLLTGAPGTGKTHLLVAALRHRLRLDPVGGMRFANVPILLDDLRAAVKFSDSETNDRFMHMRDFAPVVVLDDLGKEKATDWAVERLYVLVESRYQRMLPTLVSSNLDLSGLAEQGYEAVVSRLLGSGAWLELDGPDHRAGGGS